MNSESRDALNDVQSIGGSLYCQYLYIERMIASEFTNIFCYRSIVLMCEEQLIIVVL